MNFLHIHVVNLDGLIDRTYFNHFTGGTEMTTVWLAPAVSIALLMSIMLFLIFMPELDLCNPISEEWLRGFKKRPKCPNCSGEKIIEWRRYITNEGFLVCDRCKTFIKEIGSEDTRLKGTIKSKGLLIIALRTLSVVLSIIFISFLPSFIHALFSGILDAPVALHTTSIILPLTSFCYFFRSLSKHHKKFPLLKEMRPNFSPFID